MAALNFLHNSSALIIDLRQNGGGDARACNFLLNYFLPDSTLLMQRRTRTEKTLTNFYLTKDDAVQKFDKELPLYILTGKRTSSAAEAFAYTLQSYKRATVVGDTTNGEANPGYLFSLNSEMYIMIPAFENINPVTHTNWQGKGVVPDVFIGADKALPLAQALAYEKLSSATAVKEQRAMYDWMATGLFAEVNPPLFAEKNLNAYAGAYADNRKISVADGTLFYERTGSTATGRKLLPLKENLYGVEGLPFFRIRFVKNEKGEVTGLIGVYDDGKEEASKRL